MLRISILLLAMLTSQLSLANNSPAPDFTLKSNQGSNLRLSEYRGQVVLINFWASWCGPCRQEMPLLDEMQKKYSRLGFTILGINVDKDPAAADKILRDIPVSFPVLYDSLGEVSQNYNVSAMPTTIIVDRDGNMRYLHKGFKPGYEEKYIANIKTLIRE
ncbi:MAG: peroxiredoxin [Oceanicoccus sp.]|jgi:peroxiredoxin